MGKMKNGILDAFLGAYPDLRINYSEVFISNGFLRNPGNAKAIYQSRNVVFTWEYDAENHDDCARPDDKAILVIYCQSFNECIYSINEVNRSTGKVTIPALQFLGHKVETWVGFISANGKLTSASTYTGPLYIT